MTTPEIQTRKEGLIPPPSITTEYCKYRDIRPEPDVLLDQLKRLRGCGDATDTRLQLYTQASVCLDLAAQASRPEVAEELLNEGETCLVRTFAGEVRRKDQKDIFHAGTLLAYWHKYRAKYVERREPDISDEAQLWHGLMDPALTESELLSGPARSMARLSVSVHALNARANLRYNEILWTVAPASQREAQPAGVHLPKDGWHIGVSAAGFASPSAMKFKLFSKPIEPELFSRTKHAIVSLESNFGIGDAEELINGLRLEHKLMTESGERALTKSEEAQLQELTARHDEYGFLLMQHWQAIHNTLTV